jgi:hypothetical protein
MDCEVLLGFLLFQALNLLVIQLLTNAKSSWLVIELHMWGEEEEDKMQEGIAEFFMMEP